MKKKQEWIRILEAEVEQRFDPSQVEGFGCSAPALKLAILAYAELANMYDAASSWN